MNPGISSSYPEPPTSTTTVTQSPAGNAQPVIEHSAQLTHHAIAPTTSNPQLNRFSKHDELHRLNQLDDADFGANIRSLIDAGHADLLAQIPKSWFFAPDHHHEYWSTRVRYGDFIYRYRRDTILHYAIERRQHASLQVLVKKLPELLSLEDRRCLTAVQLAATKGDVHSIQIIASQDENCLKQTNFTGHTALWQAIKEGQLDAIRYIVRKWPQAAVHSSTWDGNYDWYGYQSLYALVVSKKTNRQILQFFLETTPGVFNRKSRIVDLLRSMVARNNEDCIRWLFTLEITRQMVSSLNSYQYFVRLSAKMPALFHELQTQKLLLPQPVKGFDFSAYKVELYRLVMHYQPISHSVANATETLDLGTQRAGIHYLHTTKAFLASIDRIGIHLKITMYPDETLASDTYASLGDPSASVQIMDRLIDLGAKNISLFVAITSGYNRFELDPDFQAFGMNKLGLLLTANAPLTHGLSIDRHGCKVKIILLNKLPVKDSTARKAQEELPVVMLSFSVVTEQFTNLHKFYHTDNTSFITVRPYDFYKSHEYLLTDIDSRKDKANSVPLHLPQHSVIQLSAGSLSEHDGDAASCEGKRPSLFAKQATDKMCAMVNSQRLHISVVYGLHCLDSEATILTQWVKAIKLQLKDRHDRPIIIAVFPNNNEEIVAVLNSLNTDGKIPLLDLAQESTSNQLDQLTDGDVLIAKMPSLPRATFNKLINSSDYPALAEGANLTSFLLQTGHPYLSVLPAGNTSVPQNMGDTLEAMKANALSYKLCLFDNESDKGKLEELWQKIRTDNFAEALAMVEDMKESDNHCNLTFLWSTPTGNSQPGRAPLVTVATLLKKFQALKADGKAPAHAALSALKAAVDPTLNCYVDFLNNCQNSQSTTVNHARLMQHHTGQPENSSICRAITKFLRHKGIPCLSG